MYRMAKRQLKYELVLCLLIVQWHFSQENLLKNPNTCGLLHCKGNGKFKYGPGIQQNYMYTVEISTLFNGTSRNESSLHVESVVNLSFITPCDGLLTLSGVKLFGGNSSVHSYNSYLPNAEEFSKVISDQSLRFGFQDGIITELCPPNEEKQWVLNFKKGILSMLHNTMNRFDLDTMIDEEDIRGKCLTHYKVLGANETTLLIEKNKDLNLCHGRSKFYSVLETSKTSNMKPDIGGDQLLQSSSQCFLSIDHNIYNNITCQEVHRLQISSKNAPGATTIILQKLWLMNEEKLKSIIPETEISRRTSLSFYHERVPKTSQVELKAARDIIKSLCKRSNKDTLGISDIILKFIKSLRLLSYPALAALYGHSKSACVIGREHFLDTLPFLKTSASVALMRDIILKETVREDTVVEWVMSTAFIANPDNNMVENIGSILQKRPFSPSMTLSVASVIHSFCSQHTDCIKTEAVSSIISYLEVRFLHLMKMNINRKRHDEIIILLKALSNIGVMSENFKKELYNMIENINLSPHLRVTAIETFRRVPCGDTRDFFKNVFRNQNEDAEVRIASYLQIMRCPNYLLIRTIRHSLLTEEVNQVGSFIWTHLRNLLKTSVPSKTEIQSLLSDDDLVRKFPRDIRKFSQNMEGSMYFDNFNFDHFLKILKYPKDLEQCLKLPMPFGIFEGGSYESNLIYSTTSFIPKSAMFNFSCDVFGESINVFEIYGRFEGLEQYLESLFGPKSSSNNETGKLVDGMRTIRSIGLNETLRKQIKSLSDKNNQIEGPKVFFGMKLFGNEITYTTFAGKEELWTAIKKLNPVQHLKQILSGKKISYKKTAMFVDCNFVVSTGVGFPLSLNVMGTSSINIKLLGSLRTTGISKGKELELDMTADIQPTISLDAIGEMVVDAYYSNTAVKIKANMFTDTAVKTSLKMKGMKLISFKFSLPRQNNVIFSASSALLLRRNNTDELQSGIISHSTNVSICSWPSLEKTIGLKLCTEYSFVNINLKENVPHFLITGPARLNIFISKSDPTATLYLFEYKWIQQRGQSIFSLIFDTPESQIRRILNANLTIDKESQNLTMLLHSSLGTVLAHGNYKNTDNEKVIHLALNINRMKHFDGTISLEKSQIKNGYSYKPFVFIRINEEKVVKLEGSIDTISKKEISQYTVDLKFETKRLQSRLFGYISKGESSIEVNLYQDYKFRYTREQRISLKFGIANRSRNNMIIVMGFCNVNTTAYSKFNFASNATFQKSGGHMDLSFELNQTPAHQFEVNEALLFNLLISYKVFTDNKSLLNIITAIRKQSSNLALKGEFIYESFRYDVNTAAFIQYGKEKEITATVFWSHPKTTLEQIKTHVNITVPSFEPMILKFDIEEKRPKEYMIDIKATWFSGYTLIIIGFYHDKCSATAINHHIKVLLNMPTLKDATIDAQLYRDNGVLKLDLRILHNNSDQQLVLHHQAMSPEETRTLAKIKYKEKTYSFFCTIYGGRHKRIHAELRIDQIRDIDFSMWIYNLDRHKSFGFEINWDANRDPNQRLLVSANYTKMSDFNNMADFRLSYPSRTVIGEHRFSLRRNNISALASLSWDDGNIFSVELDIHYAHDKNIYLGWSSKLRTPFEHWKLTKFKGLFENVENKYILNGMTAWDEGQTVSIRTFGDYLSTASTVNFKYSCSLMSSLHNIPNMNVTICHLQNQTNLNSLLHFMYNPNFIIDLDNQWMIESNKNFMNLTGIIRTYTPFKGLQKGVLISKFFLRNKNFLKGIAQLELDNKKMMVNLDGKYIKISDCLLIVNITTSSENYQLQFKISTEDRHFITLFMYPRGNLGTEILFVVNNLTNFDIKLYLATPVEFLHKVIITLKLVPNEADFRLGWNFILIGFSGIWNYHNITNFDHSYKIYTPIEDFEENGVVGRFILKDGINCEVSLQLSKYKVGIKLLGHSIHKPFKEVEIEISNIYLFSKETPIKTSGDPISWKGMLEVDSLIYPTIKGFVEIDQKGYFYILQSKLILPHGIATIYNEFEYISLNSMRYKMNINTPYQNFKSISSNFNFILDTGYRYVFALDMEYLNRTKWIKTGLWTKYIKLIDADIKVHNVTINLATPFNNIRILNIFGEFQWHKAMYQAILIFNTSNSYVSTSATTKLNDGLIEIISKFNVVTPFVYVPPCKITLIKLMEDHSNYLDINFYMPQKFIRDINIRTFWIAKSINELSLWLELETPFTGLENTTAGVDVDISAEKSRILVAGQMKPLDMKMNFMLQDSAFTSISILTFNKKRFPIIVNCTILQSSEDSRQFNGTLRFKEKVFKIYGSYDILKNFPERISIKLISQDNTYPIYFDYQIKSIALQQYRIVSSIQHNGVFTNINADLNITNKFNWECILQINPSKSPEITICLKSYSNRTSKHFIMDTYTSIEGFEISKFGATYGKYDPYYTLNGFFEVAKAKGNLDVNLSWTFLENMYVKVDGQYENVNYSTKSAVEAFYQNPRKSFQFLKAGGDIKIGNIWEAGTNLTLDLLKNIMFEGHFKTPESTKEVHSLYGNFEYIKFLRTTNFVLKYRTAHSLRKYGICGKIATPNKTNLSANIELEWNSKRYNNYASFSGSSDVFDFIYQLHSPKFTNKKFIETKIKFKSLNEYYNLTCHIFHPEEHSIAHISLFYKELANMNGIFNVTVPYTFLNYSGIDFNAHTNKQHYNRYLKIFWEGDSAVLDSKCKIERSTNLLETGRKGILFIEAPLATRHIAIINYDYEEKINSSTGHAIVNYNGFDALQAKYNRLMETTVEQSKSAIYIELKNQLMPVGAKYIHMEGYNTSSKNYSTSTICDDKYVHLYNLQNQSKFNVSGSMYIRTTESGQEYILKATHSNRTVQIWNDYEILHKEYKHHSRIELDRSTWMEYDITWANKSLEEIFDAQEILVNIFYPRRKFTANGFYNITNSMVLADGTLTWDPDKKIIQSGVNWTRISDFHEQLVLQIKHPSFEKNISISSEYEYNSTSIDGKVLIDYSVDPNQKLTLGGMLSNNTNLQISNYSYSLWAEHNTTNLKFNCRGDLYWNWTVIGSEHVTDYQRSYLPLSKSEALATVNFEQNEVKIKKGNPTTGLYHFFGRYAGEYPIYSANISVADDFNDSCGVFYLNLKKKVVYFDINMTEDGSQSIHIYGFIPDNRNSEFKIWRDYDDKSVSDVSFYMKLNHSRLISSMLHWRPELIKDIQNNIRGSIMQVYLNTLENINNTKQYVRTETSDAVFGLWMGIKPKINGFISDLRNLSVIENDIEEFKSFLNKSYHNNEFYIKDIATIILTMFDELALKSHLESLPTIVQEIWSVMGDSGQKIKKGILWAVEKLKLYYKSTTDFIHGLINGDPVENISKVFEKLIEKYDDFIKNIHVSIMQYMEFLWSQIYTTAVEHWHKTLATVEPTFLKLIHYMESIVWNTGKEFLDFLYIRKNEIMESPYFIKFTKFTHDLDRFYKDITGKNTIASIYKYITITWNFLNEKYLSSIPFGKELSAIVSEIWTEFKELGSIPSVKYFTSKCHEFYEYGKYYYDYFEIESRIYKMFTVIYVKISDLSVTALEKENRQREGKTKFIFEPNDGIMLLEQKLPMPWHAFNETPKFKEIPEIKAIYYLKKYLDTSKLSFWNLYYEYKPFVNPAEWLPPFKSQAMLVGTKYYITFDRRYYEFKGSCTYLLATDFQDHNFSIAANYNDFGRTNEIILMLKSTLIRVNVFSKHVKIGTLGIERLPLQVEESYLYQESDILTIKSAFGFILECNMKFYICVFEMSGWYFGKTAGLWGTYNNEPSDDFKMPLQVYHDISTGVNEFAKSWALSGDCKSDTFWIDHPKKPPSNVLALCEEFFTSKVSQLSPCFQIISNEGFISMCLSSTTEEEACMAAVSYINLCSYSNVPLRIPDTCVKCKLINGTEIREGDFIRLQGNTIPQTADIVLIVEAKNCNKNIRESRNIDAVIELLEKELKEMNMTNNKFAIVIFGGDGVYDDPRIITLNGKSFTDSKSILNYFADLPTGNGNKDIFNAIIFAYNLVFRPGSRRTFILIPCSECNKYNMDYDYSTVHQLLSESAISLHIIMNEHFMVLKEKEFRTPFGIDRHYAYTKRDLRVLTGDHLMRKSISVPKFALGICMSLTMETNGTIFTAKLLETDKRNAKKFATVFAKAVAQKSQSHICVDCECTALNTGFSYMECYQCTMTNFTRNAVEQHILGFEDEDSFNGSVLSSLNVLI